MGSDPSAARAFFGARDSNEVRRALAALDGAPVIVEDEQLLRAGGPGRIELPFGVVHPAGSTIQRVPVIPLDERPLERMDGGALMPGADNLRYLELLHYARLGARLRELAAPESIASAVHQLLQRAFDALCATFGGGPAPSLWEPTEVLPPDGAPAADDALAWAEEPALDRSIGCALDGESLVLLFPRRLVRLARATGAVVRSVPAPGLKLAQSTPAGEVLLENGARAFVHDFARGEWRRGLPDGLRGAIVREHEEATFLVDLRARRERRLLEVADYPDLHVVSADGGYLWIEDKEGHGGIYKADSGLRQLDVSAALGEASPQEEEEEEDGASCPRWPYAPDHAFAITDSNQWRILRRRTVFHDGRAAGRLPAPVCAAAFAPGGRELLAVGREEARLYRLDGDGAPEETSRWSLAPIFTTRS